MNLFKKLKAWARNIKDQLIILSIAYKHAGTPWYSKFFIFLALLYALSPIDLIPDFIPVLGFLDDLIILPLLILLAIKTIPEEIIQEAETQYKESPKELKKDWRGAILVIIIWVLSIVLFYNIFHSSLE